jgi:hypothetical protein
MIEMLFICEAYEDLRMGVDQFRLGVVAGKVRPKIPGFNPRPRALALRVTMRHTQRAPR